MIYLANPAGGEPTLAAMRAGLIGFIDTPAQANERPPGLVWCADNGCFGQGWPGVDRWLAWLQRHAHDVDSCLFATAPDVVGDPAATLERSRPLLPAIRDLGYPAALCAQNGLTPAMTPWEEFDCLFLGGTAECLSCGYQRPVTDPPPPRGTKPRCPHCQRVLTEWKNGAAARDLAREAKARGKWLHMGRVNGGGRMRYARDIGCGSVDGTFLKFAPTENLGRLLNFRRLVLDQQPLFDLH